MLTQSEAAHIIWLKVLEIPSVTDGFIETAVLATSLTYSNHDAYLINHLLLSLVLRPHPQLVLIGQKHPTQLPLISLTAKSAIWLPPR
jgi:hypothetical protein